MAHLIKNYKTLAATGLREDALSVFEAGLRAINTENAIQAAVRRQGARLEIAGKKFDLARYQNVYLVAFGKAAAEGAAALARILGARLSAGAVLDVKKKPCRKLQCFVGTHPFPSGKNLTATRKISSLLKNAGEKDLVIVFVSGGGSALLCAPRGLGVGRLKMLTKKMMEKGLAIGEMNTVRKHLSNVLGGRLAELAFPAEVVGLIFSDVPGDDLRMIASGPTICDQTTVGDARKIAVKYGLGRACGIVKFDFCETPKERKFFRRVSNFLILSNRTALEAMAVEARRRGYAAKIVGRAVAGEAREVGRRLVGLAKPGEVALAGGETTVTVHGRAGQGGRNQELALAALAEVAEGELVISCASDGIDNTPAAGAIADSPAREEALRQRLDINKYLDRHDSYNFFQKNNAQIVTGKTGSNVSDLMIVMRRGRK